MRLERQHFLNTEPYERTAERRDYANGFKAKRLRTRVGQLDLRVPQVRSSEFYPSVLERGSRSERALAEISFSNTDVTVSIIMCG